MKKIEITILYALLILMGTGLQAAQTEAETTFTTAKELVEYNMAHLQKIGSMLRERSRKVLHWAGAKDKKAVMGQKKGLFGVFSTSQADRFAVFKSEQDVVTAETEKLSMPLDWLALQAEQPSDVTQLFLPYEKQIAIIAKEYIIFFKAWILYLETVFLAEGKKIGQDEQDAVAAVVEYLFSWVANFNQIIEFCVVYPSLNKKLNTFKRNLLDRLEQLSSTNLFQLLKINSELQTKIDALLKKRNFYINAQKTKLFPAWFGGEIPMIGQVPFMQKYLQTMQVGPIDFESYTQQLDLLEKESLTKREKEVASKTWHLLPRTFDAHVELILILMNDILDQEIKELAQAEINVSRDYLLGTQTQRAFERIVELIQPINQLKTLEEYISDGAYAMLAKKERIETRFITFLEKQKELRKKEKELIRTRKEKNKTAIKGLQENIRALNSEITKMRLGPLGNTYQSAYTFVYEKVKKFDDVWKSYVKKLFPEQLMFLQKGENATEQDKLQFGSTQEVRQIQEFVAKVLSPLKAIANTVLKKLEYTHNANK